MFLFKFAPVSFMNIRFLLILLSKILEIVANLGTWSDMEAVKLPDIISVSLNFWNILSTRRLEWLVMLVGCKIKGINEIEASECKNWPSFAHCNSKD